MTEKQFKQSLELAKKLGGTDGATMAWEAMNDAKNDRRPAPEPGSASDFDGDLLNSIENAKARKLFHCENATDEQWFQVLSAYNKAAIAAWDDALTQ
jgi:hypothetical protein